MSGGRVGVGVIGAGVISNEYLKNLTAFPDLDVRFVADIDLERAKAQAEKFGVPGSGTVEELLADDAIEIVVNLTIPKVHVEVALQVLAAGKNVWSEKPFALDRASGRELLETAHAKGLRVATAPDTFLGSGIQSARRLVENGDIGAPLTALEFFAGRLAPEVVLEVDTYWVAVGGADPVAYLPKLGDRVVALHIKDGPGTHDNKDQVAVGQGSLPIEQIIAAAPNALRVIELDDSRGDRFQAVADSFAFLTSKGLA